MRKHKRPTGAFELCYFYFSSAAAAVLLSAVGQASSLSTAVAEEASGVVSANFGWEPGTYAPNIMSPKAHEIVTVRFILSPPPGAAHFIFIQTFEIGDGSVHEAVERHGGKMKKMLFKKPD